MDQSLLSMMDTAIQEQPAFLPSAEPPQVLPPETPATSSRGEVVAKIVQECELQHTLAGSACLSCAQSVLAKDNRQQATLYCSALFRDLQVCITDCTSHSPA